MRGVGELAREPAREPAGEVGLASASSISGAPPAPLLSSISSCIARKAARDMCPGSRAASGPRRSCPASATFTPGTSLIVLIKEG